MSDMNLAFQLMGYGLAGTFTVLIIFYIVIKLLGLIKPKEDKENPTQGGSK